MLSFEFLESNHHFTPLRLVNGDILFADGEVNNNIYFICSGKMTIEKKLSNGQIKRFAVLGEHNIFGEAALNNSDPKTVDVVCSQDAKLLYIDAQEGVTQFIKQCPKEGLALLKYIIDLGNKRLQEANHQIASQFEITQEIQALSHINYSSIFGLLDHISQMLGLDYLYYFERNPVIKNYYICKYDISQTGYLGDDIIDISEIGDLSRYKNHALYHRNISLQIGEIIMGSIVIHRKKDFSNNEDKIISTLVTALSGVFRQKKLLDEQRDRAYMRE